jgi:uncharacterized protein (TIRG00374 family)
MKTFHLSALLLGVVLLIFLIWKIGLEALWHDLSLLGWGLIPFVLVEGTAHVFHTLAWKYCLSPPHRSLPFVRLLAINLAGNSINYFTPTATLGGEVVKGTLLSLNHRGPEAATGVIIGKLALALSQLLFVILGSILILRRIDLPTALFAAMLVGSTLLGAGIVGFLVVQKHGKLGAVVRWLVAHKVGGEPMKKVANQITRVDNALKLFYIERPKDLPLAVFWHSVGMAFRILKTWYFLFLVGESSLFVAAGIWLLEIWFDLLTFAIPLGIGIQEGTRILALSALGFGLDLGLTYGIAIRLEQIFWAGVGLLFYAALLPEKRGMKAFFKKGVTSDDPSLD